MHNWLVCCGSILGLTNFFRSKWVILSLTLKERSIHVYWACLLWQYPWIDNFFHSKRVIICRSRLKNEVYMFINPRILPEQTTCISGSPFVVAVSLD